MKTACLLGAGLLSLLPLSHGAITGQWDFNEDLSATIGQEILYWDLEIQDNSEFDTTTTFGIPDINGEPAQVMKFPKTPFGGGLFVGTGATPNGGGFGVNQFTIIMDVLFPEESSGKSRALIQADHFDDAEYKITAGNGLSVGGGAAHGAIQPNTWHRIVFAVDMSQSLVDKYVDGVKVGSQSIGALDSAYTIFDSFLLFSDNDGETEAGYINSLQFRDEKLSDGLIAALGGPVASGILTGPPPNPYILSAYPSADTARIPSRSTVPPRPEIRVVIQDGTAGLVTSSVVLEFDGEPVTPEVDKDGEVTTITYTPAGLLDPLSIHSVALSFTDDATPPNQLGTSWQFAVGDFSLLEAAAVLPIDSAGERGFTVRTVQGPEFIAQVNNPTNFPVTLTRAIQQLNGTLRDIDGNLVQNEATPGPNPDGSYDLDGIINFHTQGSEVGNFPADAFFPGTEFSFHTTQFATEVLAFLELTEGVHRFGASVNVSRVDVNDDDGYTLLMGQNPRDSFSQIVGEFQNLTGGFPENAQNNNEFTFYAPEDGLYPFRLVYYQGGREGSLEWYSVDLATGDKIAINDSADARAIKAYRSSTSTRARPPFVAELTPRPGTLGNNPAEPIQILIDDDQTELDPASIQLYFEGAPVSPEIDKAGGRTTITFQPDPNRSAVTNDLRLVFADNATPANSFDREWWFTIAANQGASTVVSGQWDFDEGSLAASIGQPLEYFDGAGGQTETGTLFGTTTSFGLPDINGQPANVMEVPGADSDSIGYIMRHGITPNAGGTKVNQYTLIMDVLLDTEDTGPGAAALLQVDSLNNSDDGDLFWQGNNFGQGGGGYEGTGIFTLGEWHRVAIAVDLSANPPVITKFVDGVKQDDWNTDELDGRRALQEFAILFADGTTSDERRRLWVNSVQIQEGKLSDAQLEALGGPQAAGIPIMLDDGEPEPVDEPVLSIARAGAEITISWPAGAEGFVLESTPALGDAWNPVPGVSNNSVTVQASEAAAFYRLRK